MDKYSILFYTRAYQDLDAIYSYIAGELTEPETAEKMINTIEESVRSLDILPERGIPRKTGCFANKGYRQLFVKNYVVIYKVYPELKEVHIVTIQYAHRNF